MPQPSSIKRLPWMRRIQFYSPKAARMLVLFSYDAVATWAIAESSPLVETYCEYPGFIALDGTRTLADFWVQGAGREQFIKIEGGIDLTPEFPEQVPGPRRAANSGIYFAPPQSTRIAAHLKKVNVELRTGSHL